MLKIKNTQKLGRGVFSTQNIKRGSLIEISPLIVISKKKEVQAIMGTFLSKYVYLYTKNTIAIAGGVGSFFNHNKKNNVKWKIDFKNKVIKYYAIKDVKKGEQLFLNYGYEP